MLVVAVVLPVPEPAPAVRALRGSAFCGVVVHDVQEHLQPRAVQGVHGGLELVEHRGGPGLLGGLGRVPRVGCEEPEGVVPPVVGEPVRGQVGLVQVGVHGQQLHRGDPQAAQVLEHHGVRESRVRAAQLVGDPRVQHGEALHVGLVDHGLPPRRPGPVVVAPLVVLRDHHGDVLPAIGVRAGIGDAARWRHTRQSPPVGVQQDRFVRRVRHGSARGSGSHESVLGSLGHRGAHVPCELVRGEVRVRRIPRERDGRVVDPVVLPREPQPLPRFTGAPEHEVHLGQSRGVHRDVGGPVPGRGGVDAQRMTTRLHAGARSRTA